MTDNKKIILVVEDEEPLQIVLEDVLAVEGFTVIKAKNGAEGLEAALRQHPDLILLDILMPKMGGLEMLKKLREDAWGKSVPVIVLTNYDDRNMVATALGEGVYEYFVKTDIKIEALVAKIKQKLGM